MIIEENKDFLVFLTEIRIFKILFQFQVILCIFLSIIVPTFMLGLSKKRTGIISFLFSILTTATDPIQLHCQLVSMKYIRQKILAWKCLVFASYFEEISRRIEKIESQISMHTQRQQGFETIFQLIGTSVLTFYALSKTKTSQGLAG